MRFLVLLFVVLLPGLALAEERRVALVIGNSAYEHVARLPNPSNDATDLAAALGRLGFDVDLRIDLGYRDTRLALRDFSARAEGAEIALVYYAGHGVEIDRKNYMIPVTAEIKSDRDVEFEAIPLDNILSAVSTAQGLKIVLLDACRNNPFLTTMTRSAATWSIGRGLGRIEPSNIVVGYAARGGTLALDGEGRNSPYARALLDHLEEPGLEFGKMLRKVRDQVFTRTEGLQEPFVYGSLPGADIFLKDGTRVALAGPSKAQAAEQTLSDRQKRQSQMLESFEKTQSVDTLWGWDKFVVEYADLKDSPVYRIALAQREAARARNPYWKLKKLRKRPIWIEGVEEGPNRSVTLTREQRKQVQDALNMMGYDAGPADGAFGPKTMAAARQARLDAGLQVAPVIDSDLLRLLPNAVLTRAFLRRKAQRFDRHDLPETLEPRMKAAIEHLETRVAPLGYKFGYFGGHLYVLVLGGAADWNHINRIAKEMGGYFATIGSAAENRFLLGMFRDDKRFVKSDAKGFTYGPSFGLYQPEGSPEPRGGWTWSNGEPLRFTSWARGNPDNHGGDQKYGMFFGERGAFPTRWDDNGGVGWAGYFIEIPPPN